MIERIRRGIFDLLDALSARRCRRGQKKPRRAPQGGALRGNMRNVIVVHPPEGMFSEAVFILRDDYDPGISRGELLRQAKSAAEGHAQRALPPRRYTGLPPMAVFVLGASAAVLTLWISGVL